MNRRWRLRSLVIPLLIAVSSCSEPLGRPTPVPLPGAPAEMLDLVIEGPLRLVSGTTGSFRAILVTRATYSRRDVSQEALWASSNPALLTIDSGSAAGRLPGQTTVEARYGQWKADKAVSISAPPAGPASLVIESASVDVSGPDSRGWYGYLVRFRLRETAGESAAEIGDLLVIGPDESAWTGPSCWGDTLRVPPGGTLDTFDTEAGLKWLLYCAPGTAGKTATPTLRLIVYFSDDFGHSGSVETVITAR
jgi:hypothetical protein